MAEIPVLSFAAFSGTGKTTLIERLVRHLKAHGLRVAVLKHDAHRLVLDHEGKDSWRFTEAGAEQSIVCSQNQTALFEQRSLSLWDLLGMVHNVDLVLVEGFKQEPLSQIGLCRKATGKGFPAPPERYVAVVTDETEPEMSIPQFTFQETEALAEFIMEHRKDFTHFNDQGRAQMVDVGEKAPTRRTAAAQATVRVNPETFALIQSGGMKKGDVLTVAQIAGIMGAKRTPELIPMCHPVQTDGIDLSLCLNEADCSVEITAAVSCVGRTGVEMEALTAVSTAALTVYDMCKAVQRDMVITDIHLVKKTGGIHGDYEKART